MRTNRIPIAAGVAALAIAVTGTGLALGDDPAPKPAPGTEPMTVNAPPAQRQAAAIAGDTTDATLERLAREKERLERAEDLADERRDRAEERRELNEDLRQARMARANGIPACVDTD